MAKWKNIEGYEGYKVSDNGSVMNVSSGNFIKSHKHKTGYFYTYLYKNGTKKSFMTHRLVAKAFIPNTDDKPYINHKDSKKGNNNMTNLEWCTQKENIHHSILSGTMHNKLSSKHVRIIKHLKNIKPKMTQLEIAKLFKVGQDHISRIWSNKKRQLIII